MSENEIGGLGEKFMTRDNTRIGVVRMGKNQRSFHVERVLLTGRADFRFHAKDAQCKDKYRNCMNWKEVHNEVLKVEAEK